MKSYRELTRRGRLRRLRKLAEWAVAAYGLSGASLRFIQHGENAIYRVDAPPCVAIAVEDGPYLPNRYVLRIHAMDDEEAIASELSWLIALSQEAGLPVPAPVPTPSGEHLVRIVTSEMPHGKVVTLLRWLDGRRLDSQLRPPHLTALGQVVARLHASAASWRPPAGFTRPHWDWDSQLDFEDCGYGYWMWDIAVALCRWAWGAEWERMRDAFRDGYAQVRTLPEAQWAPLDLFVATQFATMVLWASEFLKHDPVRVAEYQPWRDGNGNKLLCFLERR